MAQLLAVVAGASGGAAAVRSLADLRLGPHPYLVSRQPRRAVELPQNLLDRAHRGHSAGCRPIRSANHPCAAHFFAWCGADWLAGTSPKVEPAKAGAAASGAAAARPGGLHRFAAQSRLFLLAAASPALPDHLFGCVCGAAGLGDCCAEQRPFPLSRLFGGRAGGLRGAVWPEQLPSQPRLVR